MASIPDLVNLLCMEAQKSLSPFGGKHRTILISKDFSNTGDFVFNNLLQSFARKEPLTPILLITMSHDWTNYSSTAAKCGYNLRRLQNGGTIEVVNIMGKFLELIKEDNCESTDLCLFIMNSVEKFMSTHSPDSNGENTTNTKPLVVMIDDLSILLSLGFKLNEIYRLFSSIDKSLRDRSKEIQSNKLSHFIVQTTMTIIDKNKQQQLSTQQSDGDLNYLITNLENMCDLRIYLRPLDTGYSTRVDGTIKILDNRLPATVELPSPSTNESGTLEQKLRSNSTLLFQPKETHGEIGTNKAFFFKLGDRRSRLTSNALIF